MYRKLSENTILSFEWQETLIQIQCSIVVYYGFTYLMTKSFTRNSLGFLLNFVITEKPNKISMFITF